MISDQSELLLWRQQEVEVPAKSWKANFLELRSKIESDTCTPHGQPLNPPLAHNIKTDQGFCHERTGALLCPIGLDWNNSESVSTLVHDHLHFNIPQD